MSIQYRPLDLTTKEIRLVKIRPPQSEDVERDTIEIDLEHVPLGREHFTREYQEWLAANATDNTAEAELEVRLDWYSAHGRRPRYTWGDYVALSYTWSSERHPRTVLVDGDQVSACANLEAALRAIRNQRHLGGGDDGDGSMCLWVDALCINQADDAEKGKQVSRMADIYTSAADVLVWLGYEDPSMCRVMDFLAALAPCWDPLATPGTVEATLSAVLDAMDPDIWALLGAFVRVPYWMRTWVLQEISKGTAAMQVLYADRSLAWLDLYHAALYFNLPPASSPLTAAVRSALAAHPAHDAARRAVTEPNYHYFLRVSNTEALRLKRVEPDLSRLFTFTRHKLAARPRDKVYGLLGLMSPNVAAAVTPRYDAAVTDADVLSAFARVWIQQSRDLEILGHTSLRPPLSPTGETMPPSWVPVFHTRYRHLLGASEPRYAAAAGTEARARFCQSEDGRADAVLVCEGIAVDVVRAVTSSFLYAANEANAELPESARKMIGDIGTNAGVDGVTNNAYGDAAGLREALWRTIVGNRDLVGRRAPDGYGSLLQGGAMGNPEMREWININYNLQVPGGRRLGEHFAGRADVLAPATRTGWLRWLGPQLAGVISEIGYRLGLLGSWLWAPFSKTLRGTQQQQMLDEAVTRVTRFAWSRRLMTMNSGRLGFGPEEARPGDVVAVLFGCSFPVLLRPHGGGRYQFVKPCYAHGVMEGEAIKAHEAGMMKTEEFFIL